MEHIQEQLARISELSEEELKSFEDSVKSEFDAIDNPQNPTREVVEKMTELADTYEAIVGEQTRRAEEASQLAAQASEAAARIKGVAAEEEAVEGTELASESEEAEAKEETEFSTKEEAPEASAEAVTEAPSESEASVEEVTEEAPAEAELSTDETVEEVVAEAPAEAELSSETTPSAEEAPAEAELSVEENTTPNETVEAELSTEELNESSEETVTASSNPDFEAPADRQPAASTVSAPVTIVAGADLHGIVAGTQLPDLLSVAQAVLDRRKAMGRTTGGDGEQGLVASFKTSYPEDRYLVRNDYDGNLAKINKVTDAKAIVAAGGLYAPVETVYDLFGMGETDARPVRDSLPVFGAERGGIRFMTPPKLEDLAEAVSVWTLQDDIAAAEEGSTLVKPCLRIKAGEEVIVYIDAIPLCLTVGNIGARAFPELVEEHLRLAMVQHARLAEIRLITRIGALSTNVAVDSELGAARDILVQVDQASAGYRARYRMDPDAPLRVMFPEWFRKALRADLVKQLPGDGRDGTFNLADAEIDSWFRTRNVNVTWFLDGEEGQGMNGPQAGATVAAGADGNARGSRGQR